MVYSTIIIPVFTLIVSIEIENTNILTTSNKFYASLAMPLAILLLSMGGIPPLTGFIPKLIAMSALVQTAPLTIMLLITGSLINLYFYLALTFNFIIVTSKTTLNPNYNDQECTGYVANLTAATATFGLIPLLI